MQCIRSILGSSRLDHVKSVDLRAMLGIDTSIVEEVCKDKLRLIGHVARMDSDTWWPRVMIDLGNQTK